MSNLFGTLALGELIDLLARRDPTQRVFFDFCAFQPTGLASYRGFYEHLALGHEPATVNGPEVRSLLERLRRGLGATYQGYKGGSYRMDKDTPLWVDNGGDASSTAIVGLAECSYMTVIVTRWADV